MAPLENKWEKGEEMIVMNFDKNHLRKILSSKGTREATPPRLHVTTPPNTQDIDKGMYGPESEWVQNLEEESFSRKQPFPLY